jgi:signal transduction histidine kinase
VNHLPGHVYWKNKEGIYLGCNYRQAISLGFKNPTEIIGKTDFELTGDISLAKNFRKNDLEVMKNGETITAEEVIKMNDQLATMISQKVPLKNYEDEIVGVLGISIDITEKKKIESALQKAQGQIDGMALVSASIAHELRTPLAGVKSALYCINSYLPKLIQAYYQALSHKLDVPMLNEAALQDISDATAGINKKIDHSNMVIDMLLTNLAHDQISTQDFSPCSILDTVQQAMEKYTFPIGQKKLVKINVKQDFVFSGKPVLIIHILFNLLKNALYFIQKARKGDIQIWTELGAHGNFLHFKDTSQGISTDVLPHIFDQFFSKGTHHGTGIGLAFSKMVMRAHGGDITCESVLGEYTDFTLCFPLAPK